MKLARRMLPLVVVCLCGVSAQVSAQSVRFKGTTTGCFYTKVVCTPSAEATKGVLKFKQGSFDATTTDGYLKLSGPTNNLGWFSVGGATRNYDGLGFLLNVNFERPYVTTAGDAGVASPNAVFTAAISGSVRANSTNSGVTIAFADEAQIFGFNGSGNSGSFGLKVADLDLTPGGGHTALTGEIQATATPEPATLTLLATGLAGLIPVARRRRTA